MTIAGWVNTPFSEALGWALLHSLWQGTLVALLLAAGGMRRTSQVRYWGGCAALLTILLGFAFTFWLALPTREQALGRGGPPVTLALLDAPAGTAPTLGPDAGEWLAWLTPFWLLGVAVHQLRLAGGWWGTRRLRRYGLCQAPAPWPARMGELATRLRVTRPVQLVESSLASVPVVVGHWRPMVLMPAGLLLSMPPGQVEAILLHELAHIRRHDYLANLLQALVESLFFYHPAVWWISGLVRAEREHCCDDLAVAANARGGAYEYALALAALEQSRSRGLANQNEPAALVAATGGNLMTRIHRLLHPAAPAAPARGWAAAPLLLTLALVSAVALAGGLSAQAPAETDPYKKWVNEDVVHIIEAREREAFLRLGSDEERQHFIGQFWQRRATPARPAEDVKKEHYRRIAYANERFRSAAKPGWNTDRGRIYIVYGPPDEIEAHPSGRNGGPPSQQWLYREIPGIGQRVIVEFLDAQRDGEYRQTLDPARKK